MKLAVVGFLASVLVFSGCICLPPSIYRPIGETVSMGCAFTSGKTQDHCYQGIATTLEDPVICGHIEAEDFKSTGSKPPKDKCYLLIAEKTLDGGPCEKIVGGMMSYTQDECYRSVLAKNAERKMNALQAKIKMNPNMPPEEMKQVQEDMAKIQQMYQMTSNMDKSMFDMKMAAIRNIKS
jgi:hypothetical protein